MGTLEDVRKMFQDFLAPELRAHGERLKNIESSQDELKAELKEFRNEVKADLKEFRSEVQTLFQKADERNDTRYKELVTAMSLEARVKRVEERGTESVSALRILLKQDFDEAWQRLARSLEEAQQRSAPQKPDPEPGSAEPGGWEPR
jgi:type I site-specific restriction-modification system R (restriction) subunit